MAKLDLMNATNKEAAAYITAAKEHEAFLKEQAEKGPVQFVPKVQLTEEEKEARRAKLREEALERRKKEKLEQAMRELISIEYVYLAKTDEFIKAITPLIRKELRGLGAKRIESCLIFPFDDGALQEAVEEGEDNLEKEVVDWSSVVHVYFKHGTGPLKLLSLTYSKWREGVKEDKQLHYILQSSFDVADIEESEYFKFEDIPEFDERIITLEY